MRKLTDYGPSIIVAMTAVFVLLVGPVAVQHLTFAQTGVRVSLATQRLAEEGSVLKQMNQAYRDIATAVEPSVVHISAQRRVSEPGMSNASAMSAGSGWIYDEYGHIVTNHHVVEDAMRIDVQLYNGEIRDAKIIGYDRSTDIAVLKIASGRLHPAVRGDATVPLRQGDMVFAFGSPFDFRFSMSSGVVSGQGRSVGVIRDQYGQTGYENFIQVDAAINPGNSGGPLTDYRGHVVGMNTAIATGPRRVYEEGQFAGIGLAIPMEMIEPVVSQLITTGEVRKGFLGVNIMDRSASVGDELRVLGFNGVGVLVARVEPDLPLGEVLRAGDVITRVNGRPISPDTNVDFRPVVTIDNLLMALPRDEQEVELTVWRFDQERDTGGRVTVKVPNRPLREAIGITLIETPERVSRRLELLGLTGRGVLLPRVDRYGPAARAGIRAGDVLTHVNDRPVAQSEQVRSLISSMLPGRSVTLRIWRFDSELDTGSTLEFDVTLAQLDPVRMAIRPQITEDRGSIPELGIIRMATATPELAEQHEVEFHAGVLMEQVSRGSTLSEIAPAGSIIVSVKGQPVETVEGFVEALSESDLLGDGVSIVVIDPEGNRISQLLRLR